MTNSRPGSPLPGTLQRLSTGELRAAMARPACPLPADKPAIFRFGTSTFRVVEANIPVAMVIASFLKKIATYLKQAGVDSSRYTVGDRQTSPDVPFDVLRDTYRALDKDPRRMGQRDGVGIPAYTILVRENDRYQQMNIAGEISPIPEGSYLFTHMKNGEVRLCPFAPGMHTTMAMFGEVKCAGEVSFDGNSAVVPRSAKPRSGGYIVSPSVRYYAQGLRAIRSASLSQQMAFEGLPFAFEDFDYRSELKAPSAGENEEVNAIRQMQNDAAGFVDQLREYQSATAIQDIATALERIYQDENRFVRSVQVQAGLIAASPPTMTAENVDSEEADWLLNDALRAYDESRVAGGSPMTAGQTAIIKTVASPLLSMPKLPDLPRSASVGSGLASLSLLGGPSSLAADDIDFDHAPGHAGGPATP